MKETRLIMGMPVTVEIADAAADENDIAAVFDYFRYIDEKFSTYKPDSEMMRINRGEIAERDWSDDMAIIFGLAEDTKQRTNGFFDIRRPNPIAANGEQGTTVMIDPSGIVKGWAIFQAAKLLESRGHKNFYIDAGGDIQTSGGNIGDSKNIENKPWSIGIKNPLKKHEIVKTVYAARNDSAGNIAGLGVATSGTYIRGEHIYNPKNGSAVNEILSLTVIGPNIYEADRFATAAFAMGMPGIHFIEQTPGLEGYMIDKHGIATMTTGFANYTHEPNL
jgi:FAD:protein FMN transferase